MMRMQHEILDKLAAIPGVTSVGLANAAPLEYLGSLGNPVYAEDKTFAEGQVPSLRRIRKITPGFFKTMGTRVVRGTRLYLDRPVQNGASPSCRRIWRASGGAIRVRRWASGFAKAAPPILARNRGRRRKRLRRRRAREAAGVRILAGLMDRYIWSGERIRP